MNNSITGFVGLDVHAQSTAISFAKAGLAKPRFVGTIGVKQSELTKTLSQLGEPTPLHVVYEAGPCGHTLVRGELGICLYLALYDSAMTAKLWLAMLDGIKQQFALTSIDFRLMQKLAKTPKHAVDSFWENACQPDSGDSEQK